MKFIALEQAGQLSEIKEAKGYNVIFKHNTTCPISIGVRSRLEQEAGKMAGVEAVYFLDLLSHRDLSDAITTQFGVPHQSPQLLLIRNGRCTYHEWGNDISAAVTAAAVKP